MERGNISLYLSNNKNTKLDFYNETNFFLINQNFPMTNFNLLVFVINNCTVLTVNILVLIWLQVMSVPWDYWDKISFISLCLRWRSSPWWTWWCSWTAPPTSPSSGSCSSPSLWGSGATPTSASTSTSIERLSPPSTSKLPKSLWPIEKKTKWRSFAIGFHLIIVDHLKIKWQIHT